MKDLATKLLEHPEVLTYTTGKDEDEETYKIEVEHLELGGNDVLVFGDKDFARRVVGIYRPDRVCIDGTFKIVPKKMSVTHRKTS